MDTETTGLDNEAEIIEIAIIDLYGNVLINERVKLVKRKRFIRASEVHGIYYRDLKDKPTFDFFYPQLLQILRNKIVLIYNAKYDARLLGQSKDACKMVDKPFYFSHWECVMEKNKQYLCLDRWPKLEGGNHSALGDCLATLALIKEMANTKLLSTTLDRYDEYRMIAASEQARRKIESQQKSTYKENTTTKIEQSKDNLPTQSRDKNLISTKNNLMVLFVFIFIFVFGLLLFYLFYHRIDK